MSTSILKIIALIAMIIDHYGEFFPNTPEYLRWIGRISIPIFIYCVFIGIQHTSNKKLYFFRLYMAGVIMFCINLTINHNFEIEMNFELTNNFFSTLFLSAIIIYLFQATSVALK
ncbi:TraX family protein [Niallia sp. JL1B1071]|uniref:TraX family protein n=1 Tax=Niallia tiangongensis TaxID=3237105 RepID=UPI0037DCED84